MPNSRLLPFGKGVTPHLQGPVSWPQGQKIGAVFRRVPEHGTILTPLLTPDGVRMESSPGCVLAGIPCGERVFSEWAILDSNQCPLPCEGYFAVP